MKPTTYKTNTFDLTLIPQPKYKIDQNVYFIDSSEIISGCYINKIKLKTEVVFSGEHLEHESELEYRLSDESHGEYFDGYWIEENKLFDSIETAKETLKKQLESQLKGIQVNISTYDRTRERLTRDIENLQKKIESL